MLTRLTLLGKDHYYAWHKNRLLGKITGVDPIFSEGNNRKR